MPVTVSFILPLPPSTNALHRNRTAAELAHGGPGRARTKAYKAWLDKAGWEMKLQCSPLPHLSGKFVMKINLPEQGRIDIDNIKAIPDLLTKMGVIDDDRCMRHLTIDPCRQADTCEIILSSLLESGSDAAA